MENAPDLLPADLRLTDRIARWPLDRFALVATALVTLAAALVAYVSIWHFQVETVVDAAVVAYRVNQETVARDLTYHFDKGDLAEAQQILVDLQARRGVTAAALLDAAGHRFSAALDQIGEAPPASEFPELPLANLQGDEAQLAKTRNSYVLALPVDLPALEATGSPSRGWLLVRRNLDAELAMFRQPLQEQALLFVALGLACAVVIQGIFNVVFRRRVDTLRFHMARAIEGEARVRVPVVGQDEMAEVMRDFNRTMESMEEAQAKLLQREAVLLEREASLSALRKALDEHAIASVTDVDGNIVFANDLFCTISGYSRETLMGQNHRLLKSGTHPESFYAEMWQTIRAGKTWRGLLENRRQDGSTYWVQSTIVPLRDEAGTIRNFASLRTDVTARERLRQGLEVLANAEADDDLLEHIVESVSAGLDARWVGVCRLSNDGQRQEVQAFWDSGRLGSPFWLEVAGTPCQHTYTNTRYTVIADELAARFNITDSMLGGVPESYRGHPIQSASGEVLGVVWAIDDRPCAETTDERLFLALAARRAAAEFLRRDAEATMSTQRERLASIVDAARLTVWEWDVASECGEYNERLAQMLGYAPGELDVTRIIARDIVHPEDYDGVRRDFRDHLAGQTPVYSTEHRMRRKDGSWLWVLDRGRVTARDENGKPLRVSGVAIDINEAKQQQLVLRAERERLDALLVAGSIGYWEWDPVNDVLEIDKTAATAFRLSKGQLKDARSRVAPLIEPEDLKRLNAEVLKLFKGESKNLSIEMRVKMGGSWRWVLVNGQIAERDTQDLVKHVLGTYIDVTPLRLAEQDVKANAERLQLTLEAADIGVWDWNLVSGELDTNGWLERTLGCVPPPDDLRSTWIGAWLDAGQRRVLGRYARRSLLKSTDMLRLEAKIRDAGGDWRWIVLRGRVTARDAAGLATRVSGVNIDATQRREIEERLQLVVDSARLGLWDMDLVTGWVVLNDRILQFAGIDPPDKRVNRADWRTYVHPDDLPHLEASVDAHCRGETETFDIEYRLRTAAGGYAWVSNTGQITNRDPAGKPLRMVGLLQDIQARREAMDALAESEVRLRTIVESSPIGIFVDDAEGMTTYVNPALAELLGMRPEDCLGTGWQQAIVEEDRDRVAGSWRKFVENPRRRAYDVQYAVKRPDGEVRAVRVKAAAFWLEGRLIGYAGAVSDLTEWNQAAEERERLQSELQQAQKMEAIGQLTGGIAHDFNNILASILGYTSLAQATLPPETSERIQEYLTAVLTAGERARELVAKMLAFSRNAPREDLRPVDPAPLIGEVARMMSSIIPSSITLDVSLPKASSTALLDPSDLHQMLVNLIVNARDALDTHGAISVKLHPPHRVMGTCSACHNAVHGAFIEIEVSDNGTGIDSAVLARIFDPFFTTKGAGKGTGMGLSVVHGVVHRSRGHIIVDSRPGQGTSFRLLFPPAEMPPETQATLEHDEEAVIKGQGQRILIVDDEPMVAAYLSELFQVNGYLVETAGDGVEALERLRSAPVSHFQLLVTDQTMPRMTGTELISEVQRERPGLPIVLCTGYSEMVSEQGAMSLGIQRFLRKPVSAEALLRAVSEVLGQATG